MHLSAVANTPTHLLVRALAQVAPLIALRREEAAASAARVATSLARQRRRLHESALQLTSVFERTGAMFDAHAAEAAALYKAFRDGLATCRAQHEAGDRVREATLDTTLTRVRRAADKASLEEALAEAVAVLSAIQQGYRQMHADSCAQARIAVGLVGARCACGAGAL